MSASPQFSIVTASYNQGRFIRDCIESVKNQTGVTWEHIVQDAGSIDETLAVLQEYPHLQVTCEKDGGMSDGINRGFRKARGEWVMWLNTDDYLLPDALARVAAFAARHHEADFIYGDTHFVDGNKRLLRVKREHPFDLNVLLYYGCYIQSTATFLRRKIIAAGQLLDVDYRVCMDFEYYLRLARLGYRIEYLPEPLAAFRWHETNTSAVQHQRRYEERLRAQRQHLAKAGRNPAISPGTLRLFHYFHRIKHALLRWRMHGAWR
jgi:glycosyltransferase involved in cell wall biosynthesis